MEYKITDQSKQEAKQIFASWIKTSSVKIHEAFEAALDALLVPVRTVDRRWIKKGAYWWSSGDYDLFYMINFYRWDLRVKNRLLISLEDKFKIYAPVWDILPELVEKWANLEIARFKGKVID